MKKQSEITFSLLSKKDMENLAKSVKETLVNAKPKIFSTADLWNIQRNSRTMLSRRSFAY